jgi:hypothetical protein
MTTVPSITLTKTSNTLHGIVCYEYVDIEVLDKLINSNLLKETFHNKVCQTIHSNEKEQLIKYKKLIRNGKSARVEYKRSKGNPFGRCNPVNGLGLFNIRRELRQTLAKRRYTDIDIKNAHPTMLYNIMDKNGYKTDRLKSYVENRQTWFDEITRVYECNEEAAKNLMIRYLYGGGFAGWKEQYKINADYEEIGTLSNFRNEVSAHQARIAEHNQSIVKVAEKIKEDSDIFDYNINGTTTSYFLQEYEVRILEQLYLYCKTNNLIPNDSVVLCADGLMIETDFYSDELLTIFENICLEKFGFDLKFVKKEMTQDYLSILDEHIQEVKDAEKDEESETKKKYRFATDDNHASSLLLNDFKDIIIPSNRSDGRLFMKVNNKWLDDESAITNYVLDYILKSNICQANKDNKYIPYAQSIKKAKNIYEALLIKIREVNKNIDIYMKFHNTTRDMICFEDGVLHFKKKQFYEWENIDFECFTTVILPYKYATYFKNPNREVIEQIKNDIFINLFGSKTNTALHFLSRAITGNIEDKNFATYLGNRDCGKGVLYECLKHAFGDYVAPFELNYLLYQRGGKDDGSSEISRKLYWTLDYEFTRIAISQETPSPEENKKVNSKMLKKLASGGDELIARRNYDRVDTTFKIDTTFMFMGNNSLTYDCNDVMEHNVEFSSVNQFKSAEEIQQMRDNGEDERLISSYKVRDNTIKTKCATCEWKCAVAYLIYENYKETPITIVVEKDAEIDEMSLRKQILTVFDIAGGNDCIICNDVYSALDGNDRKKIENELKSLGVIKKKSKKRDETRDKLCFFGISFKAAEVPDDEPSEEEKELH